jgi:hypothetical protein
MSFLGLPGWPPGQILVLAVCVFAFLASAVAEALRQPEPPPLPRRVPAPRTADSGTWQPSAANWAPCANCPHAPDEHEAVVLGPVCADPPSRVLFLGTLGGCRAEGCGCEMWACSITALEAG